MKCKCCGNDRFIGHQVIRANAAVNGNGEVVGNLFGGLETNTYDSGKPYGPFTCTKCEAEYEELSETAMPTNIRFKDGVWVFESSETPVKLSSIVEATYTEVWGYITKNTRIENGFSEKDKSHRLDALCVAGHPKAERCKEWYFQKKVRCHNRQLHKATIQKGGIQKANQLPNVIKGFRLYDKVLYQNRECFIWDRRKTGYFSLKTLNGKTVHGSAKAANLTLLETRKSYLTERRNNEMKFIFLDVDGVLNSQPYCERTGSEVNPENIRRLKEIVDATGAKIILSSTWKQIWYDTDWNAKKMKELLLHTLAEYNLSIYALTPHLPNGFRPAEIKQFLEEYERDYPEETVTWVSLDDDYSKEEYLSCGLEHGLVSKKFFCKTEDEGGIQDWHVQAAIHLLKFHGFSQ